MTADDHRLAHDLAGLAGQRLLELRARGGDPAQLKADGDRLSHEFLMAEFARLRPGDAVLSEEGQDDQVRLTSERAWIIDPLDGTREFGEVPRTDWAVHVALWERGELTAGAVALPAQEQTLSTADPAQVPPADGAPDGAKLRIVISRSRPPAFMQRLAEITDAELVPLGSAGAKVATVVLGQNDAYVHAGGQYEWDSAAPVAVARSRGLHTSRIDGSELTYNQPHPWMPDLLVCRAELAKDLLDAISKAGS
ncbi:MAG TPA: 3'(2'),5'-bisphosphate nucleotidase CysQ [Streptosporangiaceae bacterium]|jgi:3'(2'), 5'-bisphosphate nucleotidase|nr:3'(2'),5'-bisphosphate nucleotidase CysQ [Streptosporangiaceae bacterium]